MLPRWLHKEHYRSLHGIQRISSSSFNTLISAMGRGISSCLFFITTFVTYVCKQAWPGHLAPRSLLVSCSAGCHPDQAIAGKLAALALMVSGSTGCRSHQG